MHINIDFHCIYFYCALCKLLYDKHLLPKKFLQEVSDVSVEKRRHKNACSEIDLSANFASNKAMDSV